MLIAKEMGYEVQGIDISEASAEICRERGLKSCAANFLTQEFATKFDLITMWDVVEHLTDPAAFLTRARSLLTERGYIFAKIPGFGDLTVRLSNRWPRAAGTLLGAPSHIQYFDRASLAILLKRIGLKAEWFDVGAARSQVTNGSAKRRLARRARSAIKMASGDRNLYVVAHPD